MTSNGARRHNGVSVRGGARPGHGQHGQEAFQYHHHPPVHLAQSPDMIETQIIVKNTNRREPIVKV